MNLAKIMLITLTLSAFGIYLTSCNKSEDLSQEITETAYDAQYVAITKALNNVIDDTEVRTFIKSEAMKQFDGDYNFLIHDALEHRFEDGSTFADKLSTGFDNKEAFVNYIKANRRLQIAVPVHCETWNSEVYVPAVTFIDDSYDEQTTEYILAYNQDGTPTALDARNEPDVPVIVISLNERTDEIGHLINDTQEDENTALDLRMRYNGGNERITRIQIPSLRGVESWLRGGPEIRLTVRDAANNFDTDLFEGSWNRSRGDATDGFNTNVSVTSWDTSTYGDALTYAWYEEDGGAQRNWTVTISYQGASIAITFPVGKRDDRMGSRLILFSENEPYNYDTGTLRWEGDMQ